VEFKEFQGFGPNWASALGTYERGLMPRSEDTLPSLMGVSTAEEFRRSQILAFIELWRNIGVTYFIFLLMALTRTYLFLNTRVLMRATSEALDTLRPEDVTELRTLEAEAKDFNALVALIVAARAGTEPIAPYLETLIRETPTTIKLERVYLQSLSVPILISGTGESETAVIDYKNALGNVPQFTNVQLPIGSLTTLEGGRVSFSITLLVNLVKSE
jgi:hypothetical protein